MTRLNNRIKQPFWYALYAGTGVKTDADGNESGEYAVYANPVREYGNVYVAHGLAYHREYGIDDEYTQNIMVEDRDTPIDESTVVWLDVTPELDAEGALAKDESGNIVTPYNAIVRRVSRGLPEYGVAIIHLERVTTR